MICVWGRTRSKGSKPFGKKSGYHQTGNVEESGMTTRNVPPNFDAAVAAHNQRQSEVNRNISIRSIMTLPAYRNKPDENEQVLGREGDRGGVDVVLEHPTDREEEDLRDVEMETLYQIRLARRAEIAEREERRRLRREARARGDTVALAELSQRARAASNSSVISELRAEHDRLKTQRQRAVSSVSYADLGVARHDGTRLRANSQESERMGLLSDAASVAMSVNSPSLSTHHRQRSASSVLSWDSTQDLDIPQNSPGMTRSGATTPQRLSAQYSGGGFRSRSRAGSSPELIDEADLGDAEIPPHDPPGYDDVSLDDNTNYPRSGVTTPVNFNEPPPEYSTMGPTVERDRRLDEQVADMVDSVGEGGDLSERRLSGVNEPAAATNTNILSTRSTRGVGGVPQLPSLRIRELPQIVVEPSSAHPGREHESF
ncbi:hypothetical protein PG991_015899 [Apiospora marii]|uniref:Uncharacterized protein n=1 Tax=Apiospora marii TaxID=335849 RepID=A0ABR1R073_9PEZI